MSNTRTTRPPARTGAKPKPAPGPPGDTGTGDDGTDDDGNAYLEVFGGKYKVADEVGIWPLMQFARAAETGTALTDHRGLAACHAFLQDVIAPADWGRFQEDMISKKVNDLDALMSAARQAIDALVVRRDARRAANGKTAVNGTGKTAEITAGGEEEQAARDRIRASDRDRDDTIELLAAALADGRLTSDEHAERLATATAARTLGDLRALTGDLPAAAGTP
jgi:hypothetical protein